MVVPPLADALVPKGKKNAVLMSLAEIALESGSSCSCGRFAVSPLFMVMNNMLSVELRMINSP
uniref:Uncharacterized protein n=1 Tax=Aegilops tauschii TaxID=37682 RepID=M8AWN7_AEGTA